MIPTTNTRIVWILISILVLVALPSHAREEVSEATTSVSLELVSAAPPSDSSTRNLEPSGLLRLRRTDDSRQQRTVDLPSPGEIHLELPTGTSWEIRTEIPGFWAQPQVLNVRANAENDLVIRAWPLGRVVGLVEMPPRTEPLPEEIVFRSELLPLAERREVTAPAGRFPCALDLGSTPRFDCEVPVGLLDLGISLDGFAPVYRWGTQVEATTPTDLGRLRFVRGASLSGWTALPDEKLIAGRGTVELRANQAPGPRTSVTERLAETSIEGEIDGRGFFQLTGLAPGFYDLSVSYPGYAREEVPRLEIPAADETRLNGIIRLQRPFPVQLRLEPPLDWRGEPWTMEVRRSDARGIGEREPVFRGTTDEAGRVVLANQTPGPLSVEIYDSVGSRFHYEPSLWIDGESDSQHVIVLETVAIEGRLTYGSTPVAGTAWFGGRHGSPRVEVETDEDGDFEAVLPEAGRWPVEVEATLPADHETAAFGKDDTVAAELSVMIEREGEVHLEIPDTLLFGWVVDEASLPVEDAQVTAYVESVGNQARTDRDGSFALRGLPPGQLIVSAKQGTQRNGVRASDTETFTLTTGEPLGPIELSLEGRRQLAVTVQSDRGPVRGATVYFYGHVPASAYVGVGRSDDGGRFRIGIPRSAQLVRTLVFAPGHGLQADLVDVTREDVVLEVDRWSGTLSVDLGVSWSELYDRQATVLVYQDGQPVPLGRLMEWGRALGISPRHDRGFSVPGLAPGTYQVCEGSAEAVSVEHLDDWRRRARCVEGHLAAGGSLALDLER